MQQQLHASLYTCNSTNFENHPSRTN